MKRFAAFILAVALMMSFAVTVFPEGLNRIIKIGYSNFSEGTDENDGVEGSYLLEYYNKIAEYTGWQYEIVEGSWNDCITMLEKGEIDVLGFVTRTPEREKLFNYTTLDAGVSLTTIYSSINNTELSYNDYDAINGKTVGLQKGNADEIYLDEFCEENNITLKKKYYDELIDMTSALQSGEIDVFLGTDYRYSENEQVIFQFAPSPFYFVTPKSKTDVFELLECAMNKIQVDSPEYERRLHSVYFKKDNRILVNYSNMEKELINSCGKLKVVYDASQKPLSYTDSETREFRGVLADIFALISEYSGLEFEYIEAKDYAEALNMVKNGEAQLICNADSHDEKSALITSDSFISLSLDLVKNEDISNNRIAVVEGHMPPAVIDMIAADNSEIVYYDTIEECLSSTYMGRNASAVVSAYIANYVIGEKGYQYLTVVPIYEHNCTVSIGMNRNVSEAIMGIINKSLMKIPNNTINEFLISNAMNSRSVSIFVWMKNHTFITAIIAFVFSMSIFIFILENVKKRKGRVIEQNLVAIEKAKEEQQRLMERYGSELYHSFEAVYEFDYVTNESFYLGQTADGFKRIKIKDITPQKAMLMWVNKCENEEMRNKMLKQANEDAIDKLFSSGKDELSYTVRIMNDKELRYVWYTLSIRRLAWNDLERKIMICCKNVDSTIKEHNEKNRLLSDALTAAERANKAKTEFLSRMSHDIRTPMNAITGMAMLARERIDDKEFVLDCLDKTLSSSHYLIGLISEILDVARIDGGQIKMSRERFKMPEFTQSVGLLFRERAYMIGLNFVSTCDDKFNFVVVGDILRMKQILSNLLNNSFKFTPAGGSVRLDIKLEELYDNQCVVKFEVSDTGCGISPEHLSRIFEPFEQENLNSDTRHDGTGLGLSIVKRLTTLLGGTVSVQSEKGKGAIFTVTMPLDISKSNAPTEEIVLPEYEFHHQKVLVVDDNELNLDITRVLLEGSNLDVETAENGKIAYDMFCSSETGYYDIILMDIRMPVMDGREATRLIRALDRPDAITIPIIAVSADAFADEIKYSQRIGMNDYIVKPVNRSELENRMGRLLYKNTEIQKTEI